MRKKTVKCIADEIFWLVLSFLPVIAWLICLLSFGSNENMFTSEGMFSTSILNFSNFCNSISIINGNDFITQTLARVFGGGGLLPVIHPGMIKFFAYFIGIQLIHLLVDVLLFVVRLAHKWMNKATQGD